MRQGEHDANAGVVSDVAQPVRGEADVERHVRSVDLEHGQHADVGVQGGVKQQADSVPRAGAAGQQVPGQLIGSGVQLVVGQDDLAGVHGQLAAAAVVAQLVAPGLEQVLHTFPGPPPDRLLITRAHQYWSCRRSMMRLRVTPCVDQAAAHSPSDCR